MQRIMNVGCWMLDNIINATETVFSGQAESRHPGKLTTGKFIRDLNNGLAQKYNEVVNK